MVFFYLNLLLGIARKPTNLIYFIFIAVISSLFLEDSQDFPLQKKIARKEDMVKLVKNQKWKNGMITTAQFNPVLSATTDFCMWSKLCCQS